MRRKLEIVRGLMHEPQILFLDEPTTGLDPKSRKNLWGYLEDVRRGKRITMFLTTHYLEEAEQADHVAIINHGKIVTYGTPKELKRSLMQDVLLVDAADRERLRAELAPAAHALIGEAPFRLRLGNGVDAQEVLRKITIPLTFLDIERPTLEDAYLKIIGES